MLGQALSGSGSSLAFIILNRILQCCQCLLKMLLSFLLLYSNSEEPKERTIFVAKMGEGAGKGTEGPVLRVVSAVRRSHAGQLWKGAGKDPVQTITHQLGSQTYLVIHVHR